MTAATPLVSVVIPTYNRPEFLPGAVETVLGQTHGECEVVVVDDGSETDYASDVVASYDDRSTPVRLVTHADNKGLSAARNSGIEAADGEYVAFLDDDDRWHEAKLARQVAAFDRSDDVGMVSCCVAAVSPDNDFLRSERSKPTGDISREILRKNVVGTPSRVVVSRACLDDVGTFDESLPTKQDWDLYIRIAREWRVETLQEVLCYRTVHSSMSSDPAATERDLMTIRERYEELIREQGMWDASMAHYHAKVGVTHLFRGNRAAGRRHVAEAIRHEPELFHLPLYLLTFVPAAGFQRGVDLKRAVERRLADDTPTLGPETVPGLDS